MLGRLNQIVRAMLGSARPQAASALPPIVDPKVPNKPQAKQSFSKRAATATGDQKLARVDRQTAALDLTSIRTSVSGTKAQIRELAQTSPDLSASNWAYQRMVVTRNFTAVAYNQDGTPNPEATTALQQVIARFNYLTDYTDGFSGVSSIHSVAEQLVKEFRIEGAGALELVLDKARLPNRLVPISSSQIYFWEDNTGYVYPTQRPASGTEINLDQPTFFYESIDQDLLTAYADSPMEAAVQAAFADAEFSNDVRRTIKRALHPRLTASIDYEIFKKTLPPDALGDSNKLAEMRDDFISGIATTVNGLEPDDALVHFDTTKFDYLNNGNVTLNKEWDTVQNIVNGKMATGTKVPGAVLGHGSGSQNIASSETMLFVRYCEGIQIHVNSILSRALTLAVRLMGYDVYAQFEFERIDLRPDSELEAFRTMKQERVLELLSLGFLTDEQAALALTGKLPPVGFKSLSGTGFQLMQKSAIGNPTSNTSSGNNSQPQDTNKQTPQQSKGPAVTRVK